MRKIFKIGFPILCVAIIGGTFILLNKTTEKINRLKLKEDEDDLGFEEESEENIVESEFYQNEITNNTVNNIVNNITNNVVNNNIYNNVVTNTVNNNVKNISNRDVSNEIHNN